MPLVVASLLFYKLKKVNVAHTNNGHLLRQVLNVTVSQTNWFW